MAEAQIESGCGADFVVVECIENLKSAHDSLRVTLRDLERRLRALEAENQRARANRRRLDDFWIVLWSFSVLIIPAVMAFLVDAKTRDVAEQATGVIGILVNTAIFIGIPTYLSALYNAEIAPAEVSIFRDDVSDDDDVDTDDDENEAAGDQAEPEDIVPAAGIVENNNPAGDF